MTLSMLCDSFMADAIKMRRYLHQIPELRYEEWKTSAFIAETLRSYGYEIQEGIGKTGIIALLDSGKPGSTIAFRADMDALPITESTGAAYQSQHPGVMHACGHDGHTATLLLVARVLQQVKSQLKGKIKLIFQPAEEGGKGAIAMIQGGVLESPKIDAIFGYHNWPGLPLNAFASRTGCILAGSGRFEINIHGKRAHLASPKEAINPVTIGAGLVQQIEALSIPMAVINLLGFNSGDWKLGTSERAEIVGCYFVEGQEAYCQLKQHIEAIVGTYGSVAFHEFQLPTVNSCQETEMVFAAARKAGLTNIQRLESCRMAAEDFSEYLKAVPGCYFLIGAGEKTASLHTSSYDFPDEILAAAAQVMLQIAMSEK